MTQENKIELLWSELTSIDNIDDRKMTIYKDVQSNSRKYQILAEEDPNRLFEILGGDHSEITTSNWAFEYSYEDYIQENDIEYDVNEANEWDLEEKSIEHAHDTGHWYVTGTCIIEGPDNIELEFEFEYCEGYLDGIIGTPYNESEHGDHGILFD
ncbi:hypothetical protein N9G63_03140 [Chitinophagales bacterium]|nr:hypothetical protein [Chitinophagales bacterium]